MASNTSGQGAFAIDLGRAYWTYALCFVAFALLLAVLEQVGVAERAIGPIVVLFTLGAYTTIGVLARTLHVAEFYVAGRRVPAVYNGMAAAADWTGSAVFIGLVGALFALGHDALALVLGLMLGLVLIAVLIAPYLRKFGAYTIPDFVATRFSGVATRLVAVAVLIACSFAFLTAQIHATGLIAARFLGIDFEFGVLVAIGTLVASGVLGGVRAITWIQVAQYIVMLIAILIPVVALGVILYDMPVPQLGYAQALSDITELERQMVRQGTAAPGSFTEHVAPFASLGPVNFVALTLTLAIGAASFPHLLIHYTANPSVRETRRSVAWTMVFLGLILITAPACAAFAKLAIYQSAIGAPLDALPQWLADHSALGLVAVHGLSAEAIVGHVSAVKAAIAAGADSIAAVAAWLPAEAADRWSSLDGAIQAAVFNAVSDNPYVEPEVVWQRAIWSAAILDGNVDGRLALGNFAIEPKSILFATPGIAGLPAAIGAIVVAGALAATLSTASGLLTAISNSLSHDAYYRTIAPLASTAQRLVVARILMIAVAAAAGWLAVNRTDDVLRVVAWSFSLAAAGYFPVLVLGIWWKRATTTGAIAGMLVGFAVTAGYIGITEFAPAWGIEHLGMRPLDPALQTAVIGMVSDAAAIPAAGWLGISNVTAGLLGVPAGFLVIVGVSLLGRVPDETTTSLVDDIHTPRGSSHMERERAAERMREFGRSV